MTTILFIDEEKDQLERFQSYIDIVSKTLDEQVKCVVSYPLQSIDEMLQHINEIKPDAIVSDHKLNEKKTDIKHMVPYDGVELVEKYTAFRQNFPCFILTSFDMDAIHGSNDVNLVYAKVVMREDENKLPNSGLSFLQKILLQIEHYQSRIEKNSNRLKALVEKRNLGAHLTLDEEDEIIKLDEQLEKSLNTYTAISKDLKQTTNTKQLQNLLEKADEILGKINGTKN